MNDAKVVPMAALAMVAVVTVTGFLVVRKLDRIARAAERSEALLTQQQQRDAKSAAKAVEQFRRAVRGKPLPLPAPEAEEAGEQVADLPDDEEQFFSPIRRTGERSARFDIPFDLPKPLYEGIPGRLSRLYDLQDPWDGIGAGVAATEEFRLVSLGKPVSASDGFPILGDLSYVTDGDKEGTEGYYLELRNGIQYVQIDLEAEYDIYLIAMWHYHAEPRVYRDVAILSSTRADFATFEVLFNNDADDSLGLGAPRDREYVESNRGLLQAAEGNRARFVRCYSNGNSMNDLNHYIEVEVFGADAE